MEEEPLENGKMLLILNVANNTVTMQNAFLLNRIYNFLNTSPGTSRFTSKTQAQRSLQEPSTRQLVTKIKPS